jgi:malonate transporter and related proteins
MLDIIAAALLPAIATVLLGYVAAWHHDLSPKDAQVLNRMVLTYALPLAIFVDTVGTPRDELIKDLPLLVVLTAGVAVVYGLFLLVWRFWLCASLGESALAALIASAPNGPFVGPAVLGELYGSASGIPIAISGLLLYLTVAPLTVVLLMRDQSALAERSALPSRSTPSPTSSSEPSGFAANAVNAFKQQVVWVPVLGLAIVLTGLPVPKLAAKSLALFGHTSAGVALFASGVILSGYAISASRQVLALVSVKNIAQPALVWAALFLLGYPNPLLGEAVVTAALPVVVLAAILSVQFHVAEQEAASTLLLSMLLSLVTLSGFIFLTG